MGELQDLDKVGPATEEKLKQAGFKTVDELAEASVDDLTSVSIGENRAEKILQVASEETVEVQLGSEVRDEYEERGKQTTGVEKLDQFLGGGYRSGHIIGIGGPPDSGKTQMCFAALAAVTSKGEYGVYIETEKDRYDPDRIDSLAGKNVQDKVFRAKAYDLDRQLNAYRKVSKIPEQLDDDEEIGIVVIDSFNAQFRLADKFNSRGELSQRSEDIRLHLKEMFNLVSKLDVPVLTTLQVYGNPDQYSSGEWNIYGSVLQNHIHNYLIKTNNASGDMNKITLQGSSGHDTHSFLLDIRDDEVVALEEDEI